MSVVSGPLIAAIRAKMDAQFGPIPAGLQPAEISAIDAGRTKMATVIAEGTLYARDNAVVAVTGVQAGASSAPGTWS